MELKFAATTKPIPLTAEAKRRRKLVQRIDQPTINTCHMLEPANLPMRRDVPEPVHAGRLQHCVGTAIEGGAARVAMDQNIVAMPPDIRIHIKVGLMIF